MKRLLIKFTCALIAIVACLGIVSCGSKLNIDGKDKTWAFVFITDNESGEVEYCSSEFKLVYPDATMLELSCRAEDGKIYITNERTQIVHFGTYTADESYEGYYAVSMGSEEGMKRGYATITKAKLHDNSIEYNLVIIIDGYTLHFKSIEK